MEWFPKQEKKKPVYVNVVTGKVTFNPDKYKPEIFSPLLEQKNSLQEGKATGSKPKGSSGQTEEPHTS